jgi:predicted transcriptional regulator
MVKDKMAENTTASADLLALTSQIVSAHLSNNTVSIGDVPKLIEQVFATLNGVHGGAPSLGVKRDPAVPVKKSITKDYLVCLEDGSKHKMLKRHLMSAYGMTPDQYRAKWGLPADYPMVAPSYSKVRSALAKKVGLGTKRMRARVARGGKA